MNYYVYENTHNRYTLIHLVEDGMTLCGHEPRKQTQHGTWYGPISSEEAAKLIANQLAIQDGRHWSSRFCRSCEPWLP